VFRYVAFVWNDSDSAARGSAAEMARRLTERSPEWRAVFAKSGLHVYCADIRAGSSEPYAIHGHGGVVLGKLFRSGSDSASVSAPLELPDDESQRIAASGGRRLIEAFWGRYVAFLHDDVARVVRVLRDPSGGLPCFSTSFAGVHVYFSRMDDVAQLPDQSYSINWKYVAATMCQSQLQVHATGLNEVERVLGGECVEHREGEKSRAFYWNLLQMSRGGLVENPSEAVAALRFTVRDCVHAWASSYRGILHLLSGGLDSSIILACLQDAPTRPTMVCLNYYSAGSNTDERGYAQLAAGAAQCRLIERERTPSLTLEPLLRIRKSAVPTDYFFYLDEGRNEAEVAAEHGARAFFTGYGGDQIFYQSRAAHAAGDYLRLRGLRPALFEVALDAARVDKTSVWTVLGKAVRTGWLGKRWHPWDAPRTRRRRLIRADVVDDISRNVALRHPWLQAPGRIPDGKVFHAYQMMFPLDFYHPLGSEDDPELVTPLFSQPLLELAMRIPTWVLTRGGWDRALARRAFQHDVPPEIVTRRTKGGQEEHAKGILVRNLDFVRDLLLDGRLVREGLLDRSYLREVLSSGPAQLNSGNAELFGCLSTEAWVRQWTTA
jgi:asparagine synthase (glutamine-hydrolysing)